MIKINGEVFIMPTSKIESPKRKANASNKKMLHDMVMKRLGRYVGYEEDSPAKTSTPQLESNDGEIET
jgi:hypothetical protein